jgi:hypothetical protein
MRISPDTTVSSLIESWINGNRKDVINTLADDHPGLTAVLIVQGLADGRLKRTDANAIANLLIDRRVDMLREEE